MENNNTPFNENIFHEIRSALGMLTNTTEKEEPMTILMEQLLRMNTAMESIYKAISIASPAFITSGTQMQAGNNPDAEISRILTSHTDHLKAHDGHLAAHDDHFIMLTELINILNRK